MFVLVILKLSQICVYVLHLTISGTKVGDRDPIGDQTVHDCKVYLANVNRNLLPNPLNLRNDISLTSRRNPNHMTLISC